MCYSLSDGESGWRFDGEPILLRKGVNSLLEALLALRQSLVLAYSHDCCELCGCRSVIIVVGGLSSLFAAKTAVWAFFEPPGPEETSSEGKLAVDASRICAEARSSNLKHEFPHSRHGREKYLDNAGHMRCSP